MSDLDRIKAAFPYSRVTMEPPTITHGRTYTVKSADSITTIEVSQRGTCIIERQPGPNSVWGETLEHALDQFMTTYGPDRPPPTSVTTIASVVNIRLAEGAVRPVRKTDGAVGYDLCALYDCDMLAGQTHRLDTGVSLELPEGWEAQVRPRSSLSAGGIIAPVGTIDHDYRGDVGVILHNASRFSFHVKRGDRIAQLVFAKVELPVLMLAPELAPTERGSGGFGSTGR